MRFLRDADYHAPRTDALARRFLDAGLRGRSAAPTPPRSVCSRRPSPTRYGPTHNPWKHGHTAGRIERRLRGRGRERHGRRRARQRRRRIDPHPGVVLRARRAQADAWSRPHRHRPQRDLELPRLRARRVSRTVRDTADVLDVTGAPRSVGATRAPTPTRPVRRRGRHRPRARCGSGSSTRTRPATTRAAPRVRRRGHRTRRSCSSRSATSSSRRSRCRGRTRDAVMRFSSVWATECAYVVDDWAEKVGRPVDRGRRRAPHLGARRRWDAASRARVHGDGRRRDGGGRRRRPLVAIRPGRRRRPRATTSCSPRPSVSRRRRTARSTSTPRGAAHRLHPRRPSFVPFTTQSNISRPARHQPAAALDRRRPPRRRPARRRVRPRGPADPGGRPARGCGTMDRPSPARPRLNPDRSPP